MYMRDKVLTNLRAERKKLEDKLEAIKTAFPVLKSYIEVGDKTGIASSIEVIEEILEAE